jgi:hypothetical protein
VVAHSQRTSDSLNSLYWPVAGILVLPVWPVLLFGQPSNPAAPADTIYLHGDVVTGDGLLSEAPERESALAAGDGMVIAVGSDADLMTLRGALIAVKPQTPILILETKSSRSLAVARATALLSAIRGSGSINRLKPLTRSLYCVESHLSTETLSTKRR